MSVQTWEESISCDIQRLSKQFREHDKRLTILERPLGKLKEKPMENKVIFESREEFVRVLTDCGIIMDTHCQDRAVEKGYIRKSDLEILIEEAEKKYNQWNGNESHIVKNRMIEEYYNCIQAMKSEIEKLKKS